MAFKMSPIGKKKCPYSPMQKKGLINPSPVKVEASVQSKKAMAKAKAAGFDTFDEYFKDRYGEKSAEKISQGPYPKGRSFEAGGSGDFVTSSKQIFFRTILYGIGAWMIVISGFSINTLISYQVLMLLVFFIIAHKSIPRKDVILKTKNPKT